MFPTINIIYAGHVGRVSVMHAKVARWRHCSINYFSCLKFRFCLLPCHWVHDFTFVDPCFN